MSRFRHKNLNLSKLGPRVIVSDGQQPSALINGARHGHLLAGDILKAMTECVCMAASRLSIKLLKRIWSVVRPAAGFSSTNSLRGISQRKMETQVTGLPRFALSNEDDHCRVPHVTRFSKRGIPRGINRGLLIHRDRHDFHSWREGELTARILPRANAGIPNWETSPRQCDRRSCSTPRLR